ncbi:MAG: ABC transporter permease [Isosphaeraceae bacterium]
MSQHLALSALVRKDLIEFIRDRRAVIMGVIAPILLASFMSTLIGGATGSGGEAGPVRIRVVDGDSSDLSRKLIASLGKDGDFEVIEGTAEEARESVRKGQVVVGILIPEGFGDRATRAMFGPGDRPTLDLLYDPTKLAELGMVRGLLAQHVMQVVGASMMSPDSATWARYEADLETNAAMPTALRDSLLSMFREVRRVRDESKAEAQAEGPAGMRMPYETREEAVTAGKMQQSQAIYAHTFGGMAVQFTLFSAVETGALLLLERQRGVWKRLRAAPLSRRTLLAARVLSGTLIASAVIAIVFGFGALAYGIRIQGGPAGILGFAAVTLAFALMASTFGLLVASVGKTPQAARGVAILVVLVLVMLGGGWFPSQFFPAWVRQITPIIPTRWAVDGFDAATIRATSPLEMLGPAAALLGFAAVFGALAAARFRWEAD